MLQNRSEIRIDGVDYIIDEEKKEAALCFFNKNRKLNKKGAFIIPDEVDGYKVTTVGECAFHGCGKIKSVVFGVNIQEIKKWSFMLCENLEEIVFNVENVGEFPVIRKEAFFGCAKLDNILFPNIQEKADTIEGVEEAMEADILNKCEHGAFSGCVKLPDGWQKL